MSYRQNIVGGYFLLARPVDVECNPRPPLGPLSNPSDLDLDHPGRVIMRATFRIALITLRAKLSGAVYCNRSCMCVCNGRAGGRAVWVCYHDNSKLRALSSPNWVCR